MKTRRLSTILTSAYLSAMLTSSVAPVRSSASLAGTIDPAAAKAAFQGALADAAGWMADVPSPAPAVSEPEGNAAVAYKSKPAAEPEMNAELMARLIKLTRDQKDLGTIPNDICTTFKLCTGTSPMPVQMLETDNPKGLFFTMAPDPNSTDIVVVKKASDGSLEAYLTDKTHTLRAAAVSNSSGVSVVANDKAAPKFKTELKQLAREASDLPPTNGARVASNEAGG